MRALGRARNERGFGVSTSRGGSFLRGFALFLVSLDQHIHYQRQGSDRADGHQGPTHGAAMLRLQMVTEQQRDARAKQAARAGDHGNFRQAQCRGFHGGTIDRAPVRHARGTPPVGVVGFLRGTYRVCLTGRL